VDAKEHILQADHLYQEINPLIEQASSSKVVLILPLATCAHTNNTGTFLCYTGGLSNNATNFERCRA
jgi:hypothetical protein